MAFVTIPQPQRPKILPQVVAVLLGGMFLFMIIVAGMNGIFQSLYMGKILPGVHVLGVDLSGLSPVEAGTKLDQELSYPKNGKLVFRDGSQVWVATPAELGMVFDMGSSVQSAYSVGHGGLFSSLAGQVQALQTGVDVPPVFLVDQRVTYAYLKKIAAQIDKPVIEADLAIKGVEVTYIPGQTGRMLNIDATLVILMAQLQSFRDGEVPLVIEEWTPEIQDAAAQVEILRQILSAPLILSIPNPLSGDPGPWIVDIPTLVAMINIGRVQVGNVMQYQISVNPQALQPLFDKISPQLNHEAANARFTFNDETHQLDLIQSAEAGRKFDADATLKLVQQSLLAGKHEVPLKVVNQQPQVGDNATAVTLGITQLVSERATYFRGSTEQRIQNIQTASSRFHGLLIAPSEVFSMAQALGDISLENGYKEALIIYNGKTIQGVGGGVCQVSTTLFRTAFFGGYPIVERHAHAYRVSKYEQTASGIDTNLAGLDATVYFPLVDLKFTNDTPYWLLMETYVNVGLQRLTWKFYSTSDGRSATVDTSGLQNIVPAPDPLFQENPDLQKGEVNQVDWAADGADVLVTRTVMRNGQIYFTDTFQTNYQPWQAICEYGPSTEDPQAIAKDLGLCQP